MKIMLDGRRLEDRDVDALLAIAGDAAMARTLLDNGFRRKPTRTPRGLRNGDLVLRFVWEKRDGNLKVVVRSTLTLEAAGLV